MSCSGCSRVAPIQDQGWLLVQSTEPSIAEKLQETSTSLMIMQEKKDLRLSFRYDSKEQLLESLSALQAAISEKEQELVKLRITESERPQDTAELSDAVSFKQFFARMKHQDVVRIILDGQFTSHMQPIFETATGKIFGYEFLLRASEDGPLFKPFDLFTVAQQTGLHSFLDRSARISAIQTSAQYLPTGYKRFVNFLPSSIYNPNYCLTHTFAAIERLSLDPQDFVFEVVETEKIADITHLQNIFAVYRQHGVKVALDDVGSGFATLGVLSALRPDYVKIDRGLTDHCDEDVEKQQKIHEIIRRAGSFGGVVLAEGMERSEEWEYCKASGIQLAQGYLLGKPSPRPLPDMEN
ncbi:MULTISPECIES: EAL domain-containing protein [unclassified Paenibacillus]|uniref:EAL domain-containing protein n=1 Tax=unclassified Paenibacillus TaxID=185978 RepID=UPI001AE79DF4|nr:MULTISPECIES: EAL domain-containing protein [unclassified Paenibacillus]MBP1157120.1 EAL domain-containing protein (putative c-di-GMP-specific phosphodiesterase class I) [Paenibacillus sp. PvP091]MBP1172141.1 EAL domain-containing protein (putative c-di-GMP-specific phosphodiesterase class I) [Paenibacillus sp. PvR098]MBP2438522.1 EAL domain-containing protein (putative c-di-GMP-specific phosphodiesterase class I) [Paenibacillus sp. PvP052]